MPEEAEVAADELDLAYRILDLDLIDSAGRRSGKVDDLELDGDPGQPTYVAAVMSGGDALAGRFPRLLRPVAHRLFSGDARRVGWRHVTSYNPTLELAATAAELGLALGDRDPIFYDDRIEDQ